MDEHVGPARSSGGAVSAQDVVGSWVYAGGARASGRTREREAGPERRAASVGDVQCADARGRRGGWAGAPDVTWETWTALTREPSRARALFRGASDRGNTVVDSPTGRSSSPAPTTRGPPSWSAATPIQVSRSRVMMDRWRESVVSMPSLGCSPNHAGSDACTPYDSYVGAVSAFPERKTGSLRSAGALTHRGGSPRQGS